MINYPPTQKLFILVENEYLIRAFRELDDDTGDFHTVTYYYYLDHSERLTRTLSPYWSSFHIHCPLSSTTPAAGVPQLIGDWAVRRRPCYSVTICEQMEHDSTLCYSIGI